ncbi:EAL domain-containing protein [Thalassotalea ganghwensis]
MKKIFVSVPIKLLLLVVSALMLLSAGISVMSLSRLNQEFKQYQTDTLKQGQTQFQINSQHVRDKLRLWQESFADLVNIKSEKDFSKLSEELAAQFDAMQFNFNVKNAWLINDKNELLFQSKQLPAYVKDKIDEAKQLEQPIDYLYCSKVCEQLTVVPILNFDREVAYLAISVSLVDIIYDINQALKSEVAIINFPNMPLAQIREFSKVSASNQELLHALFIEHEKSNTLVEQVKQSGLQLDNTSGSYLINLMPLFANDQQQYFIALIDDVTALKQSYQDYRLQFLLSALLIFITLAILVYFVASPFTNRILMLSSALPLLALKEFEQFRGIKFRRKRFFSDELDIVTNAATELSFELEQLNIEVEQKTKELENIAMYDLLTGLPNRNMLNYQLRKAVANIARFKRGVAVLFLDLDDFKKVNDSHGHGEGDKLLIEAANRIRLSIRNIDVACRFGGDEFVVILGHVDDVDDAVAVAQEILERFKAPIKIGTSIFYVSTSIGIAFTQDELIKPEQLVSHADIAMYEAKEAGGARLHIYHADMYKRVAQRVMLESEVRQALSKNQFSLSLQPQLSAQDKRLYGFEALLRWNHPDRGMVSPDDFIPILENSEHMIELGYWVIRRCFELRAQLRDKGLDRVRIAINLSAGQFIDIHLPTYLTSLLEEFSLSADCFELELTEQTLVTNLDRAIETMDAMKALGFTFAIDDFGTGYSSLAYLKRMPVDVIKIDKSFVFGMLENHADYQIIMSTIAMVKNLGLTVVAEGVESSAQLRSLTENQCDIIQGYYFSKPIPEVDIDSFIDNHIVDGYWKTRAMA